MSALAISLPVIPRAAAFSISSLAATAAAPARLCFYCSYPATAAAPLDATIQRIIREDFATCTVIIIAHRMPTLMKCDRILVVDAGIAKEFDKPSNLIERTSLFGALIQEYAN